MPALLAKVPLEGALGPDEALERFVDWVAETGITPYPAQEEAFLELASGKHVILSTPTGSGKSLVAQFLHFRALAAGARSFYTAPTKALVSEKFFAACEDFGPESVAMLTGDASINPSAPIVCCTAEVLSNMALRQGKALDAPYVCMDEFHYYADRERGVAWQVPLLALPQARFLLMSATLGNTAPIASGKPMISIELNTTMYSAPSASTGTCNPVSCSCSSICRLSAGQRTPIGLPVSSARSAAL